MAQSKRTRAHAVRESEAIAENLLRILKKNLRESRNEDEEPADSPNKARTKPVPSADANDSVQKRAKAFFKALEDQINSNDPSKKIIDAGLDLTDADGNDLEIDHMAKKGETVVDSKGKTSQVGFYARLPGKPAGKDVLPIAVSDVEQRGIHKQ